MSRLDLLTALAVGLAVIGVALAAYVVVDDIYHHQQMSGRWARLDQALADAEENAALVRQGLHVQDAEETPEGE